MTNKKKNDKNSAGTERFDGVEALGLEGMDDAAGQSPEETAATEVIGGPVEAAGALSEATDPAVAAASFPVTTPDAASFATAPTAPTAPYQQPYAPTSPVASAPLAASFFPEDDRRPALFGTILWGVMLLGFAAFMIVTVVATVVVDPAVWLIGGLTAAGAVLVIAGIAAAIRRG